MQKKDKKICFENGDKYEDDGLQIIYYNNNGQNIRINKQDIPAKIKNFEKIYQEYTRYDTPTNSNHTGDH